MKPVFAAATCLFLTCLSAQAALQPPFFMPDGDYDTTTGFQSPTPFGDWLFEYSSAPGGSFSHLFVGSAAGHPDNVAFEVRPPPFAPTVTTVTLRTTATQTGDFGFSAMRLFNATVDLTFYRNGTPTPIALVSTVNFQSPVTAGDLLAIEFSVNSSLPDQSQITLSNIGYVPEPSAWALTAGLAAVGLLLARRWPSLRSRVCLFRP